MITLNIQGIAEVQKQLGESLQSPLRRATFRIAEKIRAELAKHPGSPRYPIRWTNAKQRRKVMGLLKEGGGRGGIVGAWKIERRADSARVSNPLWWSSYVQGSGQQGFHRDTGWITDKRVVDEIDRSGDAVSIVEDELDRWAKL